MPTGLSKDPADFRRPTSRPSRRAVLTGVAACGLVAIGLVVLLRPGGALYCRGATFDPVAWNRTPLGAHARDRHDLARRASACDTLRGWPAGRLTALLGRDRDRSHGAWAVYRTGVAYEEDLFGLRDEVMAIHVRDGRVNRVVVVSSDRVPR